MRRATFNLVLALCLCGFAAKAAESQAQAAAPPPAPSPTEMPSAPPAQAGGTQKVDAIAVRIEDDILTESEVRELAEFQQLVDGKSKPRLEVIQELTDQWILRGEANTAKYGLPPKEDVDRATAQFEEQFSSPEEFEKRRAAAGLTELAVRRIIEQQLYLARFVDYRFRSAAQVDDKQIAAYYNGEFVPQLKARGDTVPALEDVEDTIREVLIQRAITDRANKWLEETRASLKIDIVAEGAAR
jgi:hypothetical protein